MMMLTQISESIKHALIVISIITRYMDDRLNSIVGCSLYLIILDKLTL